MDFNSRNIRKYKGRIVSITYLPRGGKSSSTQTGEITAHDRDGILFNVNRSSRSEGVRNLHLDYDRLIDIGKPEKA